MRLKIWMATQEWKSKDMAAKLGVEPSAFARWNNGHSIPRLWALAKIAEITHGEVIAQDFYEHYIERHPVEAEG